LTSRGSATWKVPSATADRNGRCESVVNENIDLVQCGVMGTGEPSRNTRRVCSAKETDSTMPNCTGSKEVGKNVGKVLKQARRFVAVLGVKFKVFCAGGISSFRVLTIV